MSGRQDLFQQAMNQGHSAAWDQMWDRAANFYRQALEEFPDHPQALTNLGLALYEMQSYEEALACYQRAAQASPGDPLPEEKVAQLFERLGNLEQASKASFKAAELYLKNRDVNKAIENWGRVTRLEPESLPAHTRLAMVFERMGEKQKAVHEYLAAASLLQSAGDLEKAVSAVNQAMKILPNSKEVVEALALLRDFKQLPKPSRPRGGTAPLRMAQVRKLEAPKQKDQPELTQDPILQARQRALTGLADMLFESLDEEPKGQNPRLGLQSIMRGASSRGRPLDRTKVVLHVGQVVDLQTRERFAEAIEELNRAMEAGLESGAAYFDLGYLNVQTGNPEAAIPHLQIAVKHPDFTLGARLLLGDLHYQKQQLKEASIEYLEALKAADSQVVDKSRADDLRQLYEPLIEAHRQQADASAQERICDNVRELLLRPDWRDHLIRARQQLPSQEDGHTPIPLAEILTEANSGTVVESLNTIYELSQQGMLRSAMEEAFYALQHAPTYLPLHNYIGEILLKENRVQDACAKLMMVAHTYSARGEPQRAIDLYQHIIELSPMDMNARNHLIELLIEQDKDEAAIQQYLLLAEMYYSLADLEMARKTYTDALRFAQQSKVDRSWRVKILHHMADVDLQSLDWRQALRLFEQIRTLQPDDEKSRSNLIELNFRLGQETQALGELDNFIAFLNSTGQKEKIITFLQGLIQENPERMLVRRRLADAYRQVGRLQDAIKEYDTVGESLLERGDRLGAIQVVEAILSLNPPNRNEYQQLLVQLKGSKPFSG